MQSVDIVGLVGEVNNNNNLSLGEVRCIHKVCGLQKLIFRALLRCSESPS